MTPETELAAVVREIVRPGELVYIGNFGAQLFCVAAELIRARYRDLHVISGGLLLDQLIGAEVVEAVTFAHCWNPVGPQPAWNLRRATEARSIGEGGRRTEVRELSLGMLGAALQAAAWGVPFLPVKVNAETGYASDGWAGDMITQVHSAFGDTPVVRALRPDVAFVHADLADSAGNAVIRQPFGEHLIAAQAAARTVVVSEEVLPPGRSLPEPAHLAGIHVDHVVAVPGAVAPDGTPGRYARDVRAYAAYGADSETPERFDEWLERCLAGSES